MKFYNPWLGRIVNTAGPCLRAIFYSSNRIMTFEGVRKIDWIDCKNRRSIRYGGYWLVTYVSGFKQTFLPSYGDQLIRTERSYSS